jgi:hypothetical protein
MGLGSYTTLDDHIPYARNPTNMFKDMSITLELRDNLVGYSVL